MTDVETVELFLENAVKAAAQTRRVTGVDSMNGALQEILGTGGTVYCPRKTEKEKAVIIPDDRSVNEYVDAAFCVEEVPGAIAETGSIICSSQDGREVQAGLLPSHHIAIVSAENIYASLDDFFSSCGPTLPTNITFITGPSRTADIELTLTIGVHGPEHLSIIVY